MGVDCIAPLKKNPSTDTWYRTFYCSTQNLLLQYLEDQRFGIGLRNENGSSKVILADDGLGAIPKKIADSKYLAEFVRYLNKSGAKYGAK